MDEIRGFAVLCMVFYHGFFTFFDVFGISAAERLFDFFTPAEPYFAAAFILICGISSRLSRSNLKRGLILLGVAFLVTTATHLLGIFGLNQVIRFGILHLLAIAILIFALLKRLLDRVPDPAALGLFGFLFLFSLRIGDGLLGVPGLYLTLPDSARDVPFLYAVGIYPESFFSADYFPLFPWVFVFLAGTVLGKYVYRPLPEKILSRRLIPPLSFLGRYALIVYIVHQPLIFAIAMAAEAVMGR